MPGTAHHHHPARDDHWSYQRENFPAFCALMGVVLLATRARTQALLLGIVGLLWLVLARDAEGTTPRWGHKRGYDRITAEQDDDDELEGRRYGRHRRRGATTQESFAPLTRAATHPSPLPPALEEAPPPHPPPPDVDVDDSDSDVDGRYGDDLVVADHVGGGRDADGGAERSRAVHELQRSRLPAVLSSQALLRRVPGVKPTLRGYRSTTGQTSSYAHLR